ncbi:hypothetical protein WUBG_14508 [Wuchereria bancrofti]|uniref:Uncharacterized protein n=1 Tax=Wuchereria bancrofti TaxID=6293 RepID=J9DXR1_WUCBA|nr:hypothetical protein WUBG_14508 [Wuchereria bancrofti]
MPLECKTDYYCTEKNVRWNAVVSGDRCCCAADGITNKVESHHPSSLIAFHRTALISQIYRLNNCKYSKVKVEASKKIFIIVSRTNWCNEVIKMIFGASAEAMRKSSNVIAWATPYNYTRSIDPVNKIV